MSKHTTKAVPFYAEKAGPPRQPAPIHRVKHRPRAGRKDYSQIPRFKKG